MEVTLAGNGSRGEKRSCTLLWECYFWRNSLGPLLDTGVPMAFGHTEDANAMTAKQTGKRWENEYIQPRVLHELSLLCSESLYHLPLRGSHLEKSQWFPNSSGWHTELLLSDLLKHPFLGPSPEDLIKKLCSGTWKFASLSCPLIMWSWFWQQTLRPTALQDTRRCLQVALIWWRLFCLSFPDTMKKQGRKSK